MANVKYADPSYTDTNATDDDRVMLRTGSGADARAPLVQPKGYIDGLGMLWVSAAQIQIANGAAYIPGGKRIAELASAVNLTPALVANTWYHVYLTINGSTISAEAVQTAPAAPYAGVARTKTGDNTRRYLGSFRTNASAQIIRFEHSVATGYVAYIAHVNAAPLYVLSSGTATATTNVSCSGAVPVTSRLATVFADNSDNAQFVRVGNSDLGALSGSNYMGYLIPNSLFVTAMQLDASQAFSYGYSAAPSVGNFNARVVGYFFPR